MKDLAAILSRAQKQTEFVKYSDGTRVLILPHGGRVLGLYSSAGKRNFFWTHPTLGAVETTRDFFARDEWHNSGGDRTWLAPEMDLFFPNYPQRDVYQQPRSVDPGQYRIARTSGFKLINIATVNLPRLKCCLRVKIEKAFGPAKNPLRLETRLRLADLDYAGYTQHTSLELLDSRINPKAQIGLWNILQLPHGGEMLIPTFSRAQPQLFQGKIPHSDLVVTDHLVRYRMVQSGEPKMAIRAVQTCGRMGYIYRDQDSWNLVIRNFSVNPSAEYVDAPWNRESCVGFAVQACNVNSGLGQFSELEYHAPAIGCGTGMTRFDDVSQVWAFRGLKRQIQSVAQILVGG